MKGKIVYTATIEKEIEIPDGIVELSSKTFWERTAEQDVILEDFTESIWDSIDYSDRIGMYYEKDNRDWIIEKY